MKILVIYDSFFGNTEQIAQAMGRALASSNEVTVRRVNDVSVEQLTGSECLIMGSPTRAFRPSPATTHLLKQIPANGLNGIRVAAFDTRISVNDIKSAFGRFFLERFGYAAEKISERLKKKGGTPMVTPEGFFVADSEGPLKQGELDRAAEWAKKFVS